MAKRKKDNFNQCDSYYLHRHVHWRKIHVASFEDTMKALYPVDLYRETYVKHNTCRPKMNTCSWSINVLEKKCLK